MCSIDQRILHSVQSHEEPSDIARLFAELYGSVSLPHSVAALKISLLVAAIEAGHDSLVYYILSSDQLNVDLNFKSGYSSPSPLHAAVVHGRSDIIKLLLEHGADVNLASRACLQPSSQVCTAVELALDRDNADALSLLANWFLNERYTLLQLACLHGAFHCVQWLLSQPAHLQTINQTEHDNAIDRRTPLMLAVPHGLDLTQLLLSHGAGVDRASPATRRTALHFAVLRESYPAKVGHFVARDLVDIIRALLAAGGPVNGLDNQGQTALTLLCYHPYVESMLVSSVSGRSYDVTTHRRIITDAVSLLLDDGADTAILPPGAETPFDILTRYLQAIVRDLTSRRATSGSGATALMTSCDLMTLIGCRCEAKYSSGTCRPAETAAALVQQYVSVYRSGDGVDDTDDEMVNALADACRLLLLVSTQPELLPACLSLPDLVTRALIRQNSCVHLVLVFFRYLVNISVHPQTARAPLRDVLQRRAPSADTSVPAGEALTELLDRSRLRTLKQTCRCAILNRLKPSLRLRHVRTSLRLPRAVADYLLSLDD